MATLRKRLGDAVVSALQSGDSLLESLVAGTGSALNVEFSEEDNVDADKSKIGHIQVRAGQVLRVPFDEGENRHSKRRTYVYDIIMRLDSDVGIDNPSHDYLQALERIFADPRKFFRDHVDDSEGNLASHAGRIELDEDVMTRRRGASVEVECSLSITVTQVAALTES